MGKTNEILKVKNLSLCYGSISALKNVSIEVGKGETIALIGANGAGKSSLLKAILGIINTYSGSIIFEGQDITRSTSEHNVASGIVLIPEGGGILPLMSVKENLRLGAIYCKDDIDVRLKQVFEWFPKLKERHNQKAGTLSGGERQILAIGRSLMSTPKLLMMDEPSLGLSPTMVVEVFKIIGALKAEDYTIILSEQNAYRALQYADRGYVFELGNVIFEGTGNELMNSPKVQQAYLGG